jgi:hypothetical protein
MAVLPSKRMKPRDWGERDVGLELPDVARSGDGPSRSLRVARFDDEVDEGASDRVNDDKDLALRRCQSRARRCRWGNQPFRL